MLKALARMFRRNEAAPAAPSKAAAPIIAPQVDSLFAETQAALNDGRIEQAKERLRSLLETHPDLAEAHFLMGVIQHRREDREGARESFLLASSIRPDWWAPHFELGLLALDELKFAPAAASLEKALELGAKDARVHNGLGGAYIYLGRIPDAVEQFRKALALEPDSAQAHSNLGYVLFRDMEEYEQGARHIRHAVELAPDDLGTLCNWVMVLQRTGRHDEALQLANRLLSGDPSLTQVRMNRALILLEQGDFAAAWADYEARKQVDRNASGSDYLAPEWDGSSLRGRSIFIYAEQGLGDQIMFASCIPDVMKTAGACSIECNAKLEKLFRRSFPAARTVAERAWRNSPSLAEQTADCKVAMGSLPLFFRRSRADFPPHGGYLRADSARVEYWRAELARLPGRRKVGISWRGGLASTRRSIRSIALEEWAPILALPEIDFVSLQYGDVRKEIERFCKSTGARIQHWEEAIADYDETAALVSALDLVVSVQTAVVHLAGALGKKTWALLPSIPEWRYGNQDDTMLWYPSVILVRQLQPGDWDAVMHEVRERLTAGSMKS